MIDTTSETVLTLADAAAELPRRRRGRKPHVSTLYRWAVAGCRGIRLETIQIGGTRCTSREALQRFFDALTIAKSGVPAAQVDVSVARRTPARRLRDSERAARELARRGA